MYFSNSYVSYNATTIHPMKYKYNTLPSSIVPIALANHIVNLFPKSPPKEHQWIESLLEQILR